MKKQVLGLLALASVSLSACSVPTEDEAAAHFQNQSENYVEVTPKKESIELLGTSDNMASLNVLRDQLEKNGFEVSFNVQPDFASLLAQREVGNFDMVAIGWSTVTGAPDYAVRSLYHSEGDMSMIDDPRVDELIDLGITQRPEDYLETYRALEDHIIDEKAYTIPLYNQYKPVAFNHDLLDPESIPLFKAREMPLEYVSFLDPAANENKPLVTSSKYIELTSMDPIKANDASVALLNTNMYVRLVNLDQMDEVTSEGSLSYQHAIAEGNQDYYFILRDDIHFAAVDENGEPYDTGELVSGEDVLYSLERMANPESVPNHLTASLHQSIESAELVTDLNELRQTNLANSDSSVLDHLQASLDRPLIQLAETKDQVDNSHGVYQVVRVKTSMPNPQVLNNLAHASGGIVSKEQVSSVNDYEVSEYDPNQDISYGDQAALTQGSSYDNHLYASGPYIMIDKNNSRYTLKKNPAYRPDTDHEARIEDVTVRLISDQTSALSALRSGEVYLNSDSSISPTKYEVVQEEDHLTLELIPSNSVSYIQIDTATEGKPTAESDNFRKALLYAINQEEVGAIYNNNVLPAYTTLTPILDTGNLAVESSREKVEYYYQKYLEE